MDIFTTLIGVLLGGGVLAFIQFLIQRNDSKHDKMEEVNKSIRALSEKAKERFDVLDRKIDTVNAKGDERFAVSSRVRILRFEDELQEKRKHSKDSWDQVMSDIDYYENYCQAHPKFKNNQTVATVEHIKNGYMERLEKHDWSY
jgi:septal ring factor EnvC (AmiA/AmiB activator)